MVYNNNIIIVIRIHHGVDLIHDIVCDLVIVHACASSKGSLSSFHAPFTLSLPPSLPPSFPAVVCEPACQNGACIANNTCQCSTGYSGTQCDHIDNPGSCDLLNPCARGESCAEVAGSHICTPNCSQNSTLSLCNLGK